MSDSVMLDDMDDGITGTGSRRNHSRSAKNKNASTTRKYSMVLITCGITNLILLVYAVTITGVFIYEGCGNNQATNNTEIINNIENTNNTQIINNAEKGDLICVVSPPSSVWENYPRNLDTYITPLLPTYTVNFNTSIMQPNFVYYNIATNGGCSSSRSYFNNDPYGIDVLKHNDFGNNQNYDRGHLVPNGDHGCITYYISNVVPQNASFNQRTWAKSEKYLRDTFDGYLVFKGCEYSTHTIVSNTGKTLYIPEGCYYVVFDTKVKLPLTPYNDFVGNVLDYGYHKNKFQSIKEKKLPSWVKCHH